MAIQYSKILVKLIQDVKSKFGEFPKQTRIKLHKDNKTLLIIEITTLGYKVVISMSL